MKRYSRLSSLILATTLFSQVAFATDSYQAEISRSYMRTGSSRDAESLAKELIRVPAEFEAKRAALVKFVFSQEARDEAGTPAEYKARGLMLDLIVTQSRDELYWKEYSENLSQKHFERRAAIGTGALVGAALGLFFNRLQRVAPIRSTDPTQQFVQITAANAALKETARMEAAALGQSTLNGSLSPFGMQLTGKQVPVAEVEKALEALTRSMADVGPRFSPAPVSLFTRIQNFFNVFASESKQYAQLSAADETLENAVKRQIGQVSRYMKQADEIVDAGATGGSLAPGLPGPVVNGVPGPITGLPGSEVLKQFAWSEGYMPFEAAETALKNVASVVQSVKNSAGGNFGPVPGGVGLNEVAAFIRNPSPVIGPQAGNFAPPAVTPKLIPIPFTAWQVAFVSGGVPGRSAVTRPLAGAVLGGTFAYSAVNWDIIGVRTLDSPAAMIEKKGSALSNQSGLDAILDGKKKQ